MDKYYKELGLTSSATDSEVKKKFRELALKYHPDKGGDKEKYQKISEAYEKIISGVDESETEMSGHPFEHFAFDFQKMFRGFESFDGFERYANPKNIKLNKIITVDVELMDIYIGVKKEIQFVRRVLVSPDNKTCLDPNLGIKICKTCKGNGKCMHKYNNGPICTITERVCTSCNGDGYNLKSGYCIQERKFKFTYHIKAGEENGKIHTEYNSGDLIIHKENAIYNDLEIHIQHTNIETNKMIESINPQLRLECLKDNDLYYTYDATNLEFLTGTTINVVLPDKTIILENIDDLSLTKIISDKGCNGGNIYVKFCEVEYVKLSPEEKTILKKILYRHYQMSNCDETYI